MSSPKNVKKVVKIITLFNIVLLEIEYIFKKLKTEEKMPLNITGVSV